MDHYMIVSYSREDRFSLDKQRVVCGGLSKERAKTLKEETSDEFDFDVISSLIEFNRHDKRCQNKREHKKVLSGLNFLKDRSFYIRNFGSLVYGLLIKLLYTERGSDKDPKVEVVDGFTLVDYFYNLEDLERACQKYESMFSGKILLKVCTRTHPIDLKYMFKYLTGAEF